MNHTLGPWVVDNRTVYSKPRGVSICHLCNPTLPELSGEEEAEANGLLIAAAPRTAEEHAEMLAMLERGQKEDGFGEAEWEHMKALIAKCKERR